MSKDPRTAPAPFLFLQGRELSMRLCPEFHLQPLSCLYGRHVDFFKYLFSFYESNKMIFYRPIWWNNKFLNRFLRFIYPRYQYQDMLCCGLGVHGTADIALMNFGSVSICCYVVCMRSWSRLGIITFTPLKNLEICCDLKQFRNSTL